MKVINLFGGPGSGKSTLAAGLFCEMKLQGINCELVTEFAKDLTWEKADYNRTCSPYVFGMQYMRLHRLIGQVDYVITDSPIVLSCYYGRSEPPAFISMVLHYHQQFDNMNYILVPDRSKPYQPIGRNQTESEAAEVHSGIWNMLNLYGLPKQPVYPGRKGINHILSDAKATGI